MEAKIQLPYTLQTVVGMVTNSGLPKTRDPPQDYDKGVPFLDSHEPFNLPHIVPYLRNSRERIQGVWNITSFESYLKADWFAPEVSPIIDVAISCIRQRRIPNPALTLPQHLNTRDITRYISNIEACRNPSVSIHTLTKHIRSRTRLDLEQAAGLVVSALVHDGRLDDAAVLLREMGGVLACADMRMPTPSLEEDASALPNTFTHGISNAAFAHLAQKAQLWCHGAKGLGGSRGDDSHVVDLDLNLNPPPGNYPDLVRLLLRVRRVRPANKRRCLYIPAWMFEAAGIAPLGGHVKFLGEYQAALERKGLLREGINGYEWPEEDPSMDSIILSKHLFRVLQRRIFSLFQFWIPATSLRRGVRILEEKVLYRSEWMDRRLGETEDVALVAFWFFELQRRLQLKVVSDQYWSRFLEKGEGAMLYQNNLRLKSTLELALAGIAGQDGMDVGITRDDTLAFIDKTCLLMKEYVDVYGRGKKENLVFSRGGRGGSGRGAVDEYNKLCDILQELKLRAADDKIENVPGPVYKFLAKDIMHWNDSWEDDAFAGGRVHGWEDWVRDRGLLAR